jgi:hypothetical protein
VTRFPIVLACVVVLAAQDKPIPRPAADLGQAAARRNENIQVNLIDNDATKEANIRLGDNVTAVTQPAVEASYYAAEHGRSPERAAPTAPLPAGWHGELSETLQNSVFNARTFFQVGGVQPSRRNSYGGRVSGHAGWLGALSGSFSQRKVQGMVNGNVQVPLGSERTPLATDPAVRAIVSRFLAAYGTELPNRPDFDPRALNTNSPQRVDQTDASLLLNREVGGHSRLSLSHALGRQRVDAFQLVAGQNPNTEIHTHRSRLAFDRVFSESASLRLESWFNRNLSDLRSEPNAAGPLVKTANQLQDLGPDVQFPIHRASNTFYWSAVYRRATNGGRHEFTAGGDASRYQVNGIENANSRGLFMFNSDSQHTAVDNLRLGLPTQYEVTVGPMNRGFRNLEANFFAADRWRAGPRLELYYGLRYNLLTAPHEVNGLNTLPFGCDCNNFSPRAAIAYRLPGQWMLRTSYTVSFAQIYPVTYGQVRFNAPLAHRVQVQTPSLVNPLQGIDVNNATTRQSPTLYSPDLVSPYVHQYQLTLEKDIHGFLWRSAYVGSRTFKLLDAYYVNRAVPVPGIPLTTATVDQRRPDPRYTDVRWLVNSGAGYLDAAQFSLIAPRLRGFSWGVNYTFGKALDTGADYASVAANNDIIKLRPQSQFDSQHDRKGLSNFDSTHSLVVRYAWDLRGFQFSGTALMRTGTPFLVNTGSDSPGYGNVDGNTGDRPSILDPSILGATVGNPDIAPEILQRSRFAYIVPGEARGNLGRNTFRKGGIANLNAAVTREFGLGARTGRVRLRAEAFNLTNHPQFDQPQYNLSNPAFGRITNTLNDGRVFELSVRWSL